MAAPLRNSAQLIAPLAEQDSARPNAAIVQEIARLELLRRLSMGAAHTMNNAFTAILGETLCLLDERKDDPAVAEACTLIQQEIERCARLTRSVAMRAQRRESLLDETDLASLVRSVEPLLRETVSRSVTIHCESPSRGLYVRGGSEDLELLVLLLAHRLVLTTRSGGHLQVRVESAASHLDVVLELRIEAPAAIASEPADAGWDALVGEAAHAIAERSRVRILDDEPHARRLRFEVVPTA